MSEKERVVERKPLIWWDSENHLEADINAQREVFMRETFGNAVETPSHGWRIVAERVEKEPENPLRICTLCWKEIHPLASYQVTVTIDACTFQHLAGACPEPSESERLARDVEHLNRFQSTKYGNDGGKGGWHRDSDYARMMTEVANRLRETDPDSQSSHNRSDGKP
jgi:hypothetical protein